MSGAARACRASASIIVVDADGADSSPLVAQLRRRYGTDYDIVAERSASAALRRLAQLSAEARDVAIVLADRRLPDGSGIDLLAKAEKFHPSAKRAVLVSWGDAWGGDPAGAEDIVRAAALGEIDNFVLKPAVDPDERFHAAIAGFLDDWARQHRPQFEVIRIVGERWSEVSHNFRDHLERMSLPFSFHEPDSAQGRALLELAATDGPLPVAVLHDGRVFVHPTAIEIVEALGINVTDEPRTYDVAVVGGGPAGLAAAVYAASEGLRVVVVESEVPGGQAGTSSLIRNYLGFPNGVSGAELAARAYQQARLFGARFLIARTVTGLRAEGDLRMLTLDDGSQLRSRTVVLTTGVSYRRTGIDSLDTRIGRGVFYGAATTEAPAMRGEHVFVVGGANSAGQAAIHLARFAATVTMLVRGPSLATGMSDYLVQDIEATPNIAVRLNSDIVQAHGEQRLRSLVLRDRVTGSTQQVPAAAVFILIGAVPRTAWLPEAVKRDQRGFVLTGAGLWATAAGAQAPIAPLATSLPGVFAAGDVRADSVKRVASSVGEGSGAIRFVHEYLASLPAIARLG